MRCEYLPGGVFALHHPRDLSAARGVSVVLVPPFGTEEATSYRERRWLADRFAAAGHSTLRIDLPGVGDSAGSLTDPDRLDAWSSAVRAAVIRMEADDERVAIVAMGLGAVAAIGAVQSGVDVHALVLWAAPKDGRAAARRLRSQARLQPNRMVDDAGGASALPDGGLEVGGFVLEPTMLERLSNVDLAVARPGSVARVLLLGRDLEAAPEAIARAWREADAVVEEATGEGYEATLDHPERTNPPLSTAERLVAWLGREEPRTPISAPTDSPPSPVRQVEVPGGTEEAFTIDGPQGRLFGILTRPTNVSADVGGLCVVLFNAGAQRRSGPHRMWTEAARRWALQGVPTLRIDLAAVGDSDGDSTSYREVAAFYRPGSLDEARLILDELERRHVAHRFVLGGLCSGAYVSFQVGAKDPRVAALALLNPGALVWADDLHQRRSAGRLRRAVSREGWVTFLRGGLSKRAIVASLATATRLTARRLLRRRGSTPAADLITAAAGFDRLRDAAVAVVIAVSGEEPITSDLDRDGTLARLDDWSNLVWVDLPGHDHELRPVAAQRAGHAVLDRAVAAGLRASGPSASGSKGEVLRSA